MSAPDALQAPAKTPGAIRSARLRRRRRENLKVVPVEIEEFDALSALLDRRRLSEAESRNAVAVGRAIAAIFAEWVAKNKCD